jgi:hypothetical protein
METFIIIIVVLALFHFVYEAIILPSILRKLYFKIEKLKDEAISIVLESNGKIPPIEFNITICSLDYLSRNIKSFNFIKILKGYIFAKNNPDAIKKYEKIETENSSNKKLLKLKKEEIDIVFPAFLANSFMLILYLLPVIFVVTVFLIFFGKTKKAYKIVKNSYEIESNIDEIPNEGYCLA